MSGTLRFLGAAGTVTGAGAELGAAARRARDARRRAPLARAPRPFRLPAAARPRRLRGTDLLLAGDRRSVENHAAGRGEAPGGGGRAPEPLGRLRPLAFAERFTPAAGVDARFIPSGHILGASIVEVRLGGRALVYSGDLGRYEVPVMRDPEPVEAADILLVESTYGDRLHPRDDGTATIEEAVRRAVATGGILLNPAFAVGRPQDVLYLDSPMAIAATRLNDLEGPAIVVAGSGMATGGRVLHHLRHRLPDPRTTVLFVGYQAAGTRGRLLRDGAERVRIFGEEVPVRATILMTDALSAHADRREILRWLGGFRRAPAATYAVHGEPPAAEALREAIEKDLGWPCRVAADGERVPPLRPDILVA